MISISGSISYGGETIELEEDLYDYYRITLNKDGSCLIESKSSTSTALIENEGTWEYDDGELKIKSVSYGATVVELMEWDDGVITYDCEQSAQGMTIKMRLILKKQ